MIFYKIKDLTLKHKRDTGNSLTYEDIAQATGLARNTIARMASRTDYVTTTATLEKLCQFFRVPIEEFMEIQPDSDRG